MKKAVLAGICEKKNASHFQTGMEECQALCDAAGYEVVSVLTQNSDHMDVRTAFRQGKLNELKESIETTHAEIIIFYNPLTIQCAERISAFCDDTEVIDRTALILNIFSLRAHTRQAQLQVEMARIQYALPRILDSDEEETHQRGGAYTNRGSGEMRSAVLARSYHRRLKELRIQLKRLQAQNDQSENRRNRTMLKRAALIGYTNAGKSSFMNAVLSDSVENGSYVLEKDQLFATLDTSVRLVSDSHRKYLLYDTVGFVSDLPRQLLDAFHTTLDSARNADLLIHIVDASDPAWLEKMEVTKSTLQEIGASGIPVLTIFNKIDKAENKGQFDGICVSCLTKQGISEAEKEIIKRLYPKEISMEVLLPYNEMSMYDKYKQVLTIHPLSQNEKGMVLELAGPERYIRVFSKYRTGENNE